MNNLELELKLSVAHVNTILKHLAKGAYEEVTEIITSLHTQAKPQVEAATNTASASESSTSVQA